MYPLSFHTRTSTSLPRRRYDISLESSRCQWPGICISPENTRGKGDREDGWCAEGVKKREGWNVPPLHPLFFPSRLLERTVGGERRGWGKFRALFNRPYWPEWFSWEDEQLISCDLSRFRDFDGRIVDLGAITFCSMIFCAWQICRNQIRVDRSG